MRHLLYVVPDREGKPQVRTKWGGMIAAPILCSHISVLVGVINSRETLCPVSNSCIRYCYPLPGHTNGQGATNIQTSRRCARTHTISARPLDEGGGNISLA